MLNIGLYGINGHQVPVKLPEHLRARVAAVAGYPAERLDEAFGVDTPERKAVKEYGTLEELLADPSIDLVSLCSPMRSQQAADARRCLEAGKHVYAEKPAALTDDDLDALLNTVARTGKQFREMAGSFLELPIQAIRRAVECGELGTIVHVQAQKSYPWYEGRPQNHEKDGGLIRQAGVHATRFIIGATGLKITAMTTIATGLGNPGDGDIHVAAASLFILENGAIGAINYNYLNPMNFGAWGNDQIRVYGTKGMAESVDGLQRNRLCIPGREETDLPMPPHPLPTDYLEHYVNCLLDGTPMPVSLQDEMAALRAVIAAHQSALTGARVVVKAPLPTIATS
ncbi:MAG: Gfo/Idh/MocA family protein [Armatimonadota bacterium]